MPSLTPSRRTGSTKHEGTKHEELEDAMDWTMLPILAAVLIAALTLVRRAVVLEFQRGVLYRNGRFVRVLSPGAYWLPAWGTKLELVDVRLRTETVPGQEVLAADGLGIKISLAARYQVEDPVAAVNRSESFGDALYLELQVALRTVVSALRVDELLVQRGDVSQRVTALAAAKAAELGLRLQAVDVKDVMFPGELKRIFAQEVKAQKEGLAALQRARGETAALRHLGNAARMVQDNPALMQLRLLQSIGDGSGNTIVLGVPGPVTPVPVRGKGTQHGHEAEPPTADG